MSARHSCRDPGTHSTHRKQRWRPGTKQPTARGPPRVLCSSAFSPSDVQKLQQLQSTDTSLTWFGLCPSLPRSLPPFLSLSLSLSLSLPRAQVTTEAKLEILQSMPTAPFTEGYLRACVIQGATVGLHGPIPRLLKSPLNAWEASL